METLEFKITGTTPLLFHNEDAANPLHPGCRALAAATKEKKRGGDIDEALQRIAFLEFSVGMYLDREGHPVIPAKCLLATLIAGGRMTKDGKKMEGVTWLKHAYRFDFHNPDGSVYTGPWTLEALWDAGFHDSRMVRVTSSRVLRTRPCFPVGWTLTADCAFDSSGVSAELITGALTRAGRFGGLCEARKIGFGRFDVAVSE